MILVEGLDEDMFEDIADMTLIDEDTRWLNFLLMQVAPPGGEISY